MEFHWENSSELKAKACMRYYVISEQLISGYVGLRSEPWAAPLWDERLNYLKLFSHVWLFGNPMDCSLPGSSVHGISQAKYWSGCHALLQRSSRSRDQTCVSSACNAGDLGSIPGLGRSPGGGHGNPLQYSCLENPHGQGSLESYSPWGCKELNTAE